MMAVYSSNALEQVIHGGCKWGGTFLVVNSAGVDDAPAQLFDDDECVTQNLKDASSQAKKTCMCRWCFAVTTRIDYLEME